VLGTTISPYLFFWQTSEVVEEEIADHRLAQKGGSPRVSRQFIRKLRLDNGVGMMFSNVTAWFIIITAATVLHQNGVTNISSAADAAKALEPLVQNFANGGLITKSIFATGIVGLGLLAVPVLAGSASYALSEVMGWNEGLYRKFKRARGFYLVISLATLFGLAMNFVGIDPIKALIYSAVLNGLAAVPLLYLIAKITRRPDIMGEYQSGKLSNGLVWLTFILMAGSAVLLLFSLGS
jgi:Mn2+/Fe2+ NRAMP family transporter